MICFVYHQYWYISYYFLQSLEVACALAFFSFKKVKKMMFRALAIRDSLFVIHSDEGLASASRSS